MRRAIRCAWALGLVVAASFAQTAPTRSCEANWTATIEAGSPGMGATLGASKDPADWVEPNLEGAFGIGFDTHNPKTDDIFNADGNIYGRPEREVSLHLNGREIANVLCPTELLGKHSFRVLIQSVVGGSEVSVWVDRKPVYDKWSVPWLKPSDGAWRVGSADRCTIEGLRAKAAGPAQKVEQAARVAVFDKVLNDASRHRFAREVELPASVDGIGRVLGTLRLDATPAGLDPWDRIASIYVTDASGERFEILRYMTPYRKGWEWTVDLTDYLPLLQGKRTFSLECETWGAGWLASFSLDYVQGPLKRVPIEVKRLWAGVVTLGQSPKAVEAFFVPRTMTLHPKTRAAKVRLCVTGHGMSPNTDNAAEFLPLWRVFSVNGHTFKDTLWKEDNYLNPCRPQGGTWKFDRAGWAPGDVVTPWIVDVSKLVKPGKEATFGYEVQPYVNRTPVDGNPARHVVEVQLVQYR